MRNGSLTLLALAAIALLAAIFIPVHDNSTPPQADKTVTIQGEVRERNFQGIPGSTPPSAYSVTDNGTTYYLLFSADSTSKSVAGGTNVEVYGILKQTQSETPDGAVKTWTVIEVKSIKTLP